MGTKKRMKAKKRPGSSRASKKSTAKGPRRSKKRSVPSRSKLTEAAPVLAPASPPQGTPISVTLRTPAGEVAQLQDNEILQRAAMAWSFKVRNRVKWNSSERGRRAQAEQCHALALQLGLTEGHLRTIAEQGLLEVSIPYVRERSGWGPRILPWEYVVSGATRSLRDPKAKPLTVVRHLDRGSVPPPDVPGTKLLIVASTPGELGDIYDLTDELGLAPERLGKKVSKKVLRNPTLPKLHHTMASFAPDIVHLAGVDVHQGAELLEWPESKDRWDGMILADENGEPRGETAQALASALGSGVRKPKLVVANLYHSAARTAALIVGEGAGAALGFQDTIDDLAAEMFIGNFYRAWASTDGDALVAFQASWDALASYPELLGTGIVLWSARSLVANAQGTVSRVQDQTQSISRDRQTIVTFGSLLRARAGLLVDCQAKECLNYSLLHNRQPLFDKFTIRKPISLTGSIPDVRVEVELSAGGAPVKYLSTETVSDLGVDMAQRVFVPLTSDLTRTLEESLDTALRVRVTVGDYEILHVSHRVTLLPINEWVDDDGLRQFLPSFVWPLDPTVRRIIAESQRYVHAFADDPAAGFDGYQCVDWELDDPTAGIDHQVAAIWRGLLDRNLGYINPPPSYTKFSQRLRTPSSILEGGRGTCIDLALLLCACLEYVEIHPVVFLLEGHAFPGYWRSEEAWEAFCGLNEDIGPTAREAEERAAPDLGDAAWMFPSTSVSSVRRDVYRRVRDQVEEGNLVPLESVWLTTHSGFEEAMDDGWDNLADPKEFHSLIDIHSARSARRPVTPLPLGARL
jgi:hypothetical protein